MNYACRAYQLFADKHDPQSGGDSHGWKTVDVK